jgi:hypothetical protein
MAARRSGELMEDFLGFIVLFVIFVLGPIIEQARRKQRPPAQRRRPGMTPPAEARPGPPARTEPPVPRSETEDASATTMLPDELWEILTGQPRPKPEPQRVPAPDVEIEDVDLEETATREDRRFESLPARTAPTLPEVIVRNEPPVVVSMETMPIDAQTRHREFHEKLERTTTVVQAISTQVHPRLTRRQDLRDAIMIQAILGPPKALE